MANRIDFVAQISTQERAAMVLRKCTDGRPTFVIVEDEDRATQLTNALRENAQGSIVFIQPGDRLGEYYTLRYGPLTLQRKDGLWEPEDMAVFYIRQGSDLDPSLVMKVIGRAKQIVCIGTRDAASSNPQLSKWISGASLPADDPEATVIMSLVRQ